LDLGPLDGGQVFAIVGMVKQPVRVAIVDDDLPVRRALARVLSTHSFRPETFSSAAEFLTSMTKTGVPDCLVLDLQMPDMTGLELCQHLAHNRIQVPIIVITAVNEAGLQERCMAAGVCAVFFKPVDGDQLSAAVRAAIAGSTNA
jgi:FixJ family two-component response regulator